LSLSFAVVSTLGVGPYAFRGQTHIAASAVSTMVRGRPCCSDEEDNDDGNCAAEDADDRAEDEDDIADYRSLIAGHKRAMGRSFFNRRRADSCGSEEEEEEDRHDKGNEDTDSGGGGGGGGGGGDTASDAEDGPDFAWLQSDDEADIDAATAAAAAAAEADDDDDAERVERLLAAAKCQGPADPPLIAAADPGTVVAGAQRPSLLPLSPPSLPPPPPPSTPPGVPPQPPPSVAVVAQLALQSTGGALSLWDGRWFYTEDATTRLLPDYIEVGRRPEVVEAPAASGEVAASSSAAEERPPLPLKLLHRLKARTTCACMNDGEPFDGPVHSLPVRVRWERSKTEATAVAAAAATKTLLRVPRPRPRRRIPAEVHCLGIFCSWPCALLYARLHYSSGECLRVRQYLTELLGTWYLPREAPPPERLLRKFIGPRGLTIEEYRAQLCGGPRRRCGVYRELAYPLIADVTVVEGTHEAQGVPDGLMDAGVAMPDQGVASLRRRYWQGGGGRGQRYGRKSAAAAAAGPMSPSLPSSQRRPQRRRGPQKRRGRQDADADADMTDAGRRNCPGRRRRQPTSIEQWGPLSPNLPPYAPTTASEAAADAPVASAVLTTNEPGIVLAVPMMMSTTPTASTASLLTGAAVPLAPVSALQRNRKTRRLTLRSVTGVLTTTATSAATQEEGTTAAADYSRVSYGTLDAVGAVIQTVRRTSAPRAGRGIMAILRPQQQQQQP